MCRRLRLSPSPAGTMHGRQALLIEALHQLADTVATLLPCLTRRLGAGMSSLPG